MLNDPRDSDYNRRCDDLSQRFPDVQLYTDTGAHSSLRITILVGGLNNPSPRQYMDEVVRAFVEERGYNEFIDEFRDNPYTRIIIEGFNNGDIPWINSL